MQLRSFGAYAQTAPYIPFAQACTLTNLDGTAAGAGFLQIHDLAVAPGNGAVPLKSFDVNSPDTGGTLYPLPSIFQSLGPIVLRNGLCLAFSSTEATYTADSTAVDYFGEIEEFGLQPDTTDGFGNLMSGVSVAGDLTTGRDALSIAAAGHTLVHLDYVNNDGATRYLQLFTAIASDGLIPVEQWTAASGATLSLNFGLYGRTFYSESTAGVVTTAMRLYQSSTTGVKTVTTSTASYMRAYYR